VKILPHKFSKINFKALKAELWFWAGFGVFLYAVGKGLDVHVFQFIEQYLRCPVIDQYILFLTEELLWWILILFALVTGYRVWTKPDNQTKLLPALFALVVTGMLAFVFKSLFAIPRPFLVLPLLPLASAPSMSFPSAHTALAFALLIPFVRISRITGFFWLLFSLFIGFARVYENLHYPSDIAGGIFLGGIVGAFFSHPDIKKILEVLWEELEFRRQSFHFVAGFLAVFAHWAGFLRLRHIAILLVVGLIVSILTQKGKLSFVQSILKFFDRPRDKNFPGRGAFYLLLGIFITFIIFPIKIAYASILILSVGDSLNRLFASKVPGHLKFPWNRRKNCIGVAIGIVAGTLVSQFFVPIVPAFLASVLAIVGETIPVRFGKFYLDDNIFVPLIAGGVLWLLV